MTKITKMDSRYRIEYWVKCHIVINFILENPLFYQRGRYKALIKWVEKKLAVGERQAKRYISDARKEITKIFSSKTDEAIKITLIFYQRIINDCLNATDKKEKYLRLALETIKEQNKLLGLYPDKKIQSENINYEFDLSKLTEKGLERIKRGDDPREVLMDTESLKVKE